MARYTSLISGLVLLLCLVFAVGLISGVRKLAPYHWAKQVQDVFEEMPNVLGTRPTHWTKPRQYDGKGVTQHRAASAGDEVIMLQGLFDGQHEIRLIEQDGSVLRRWPFSPGELTEGVSHLKNRPLVDWNYDSHGSAMLADGSVVFNIDQIALVKLDRCGERVWRVDARAHHSVEPADDGTIWVSSSIHHVDSSPLPAWLFRPPYAEDTLLQVSADGEVVKEISLIEVFVKNDAWGLLTVAGGPDTATYAAARPDIDRELFHLNDVEALPASLADAFPQFEAGDLLVSVRNRNLVLVIDPETLEIKWHSVGPWIRQHDPDWHGSGTIRTFDNNREGPGDGESLGRSRIIETNPVANTHRVLLGSGSDPNFYTKRRGKHQQLPHGRILATEAETGRVFITDSNNAIVWEYHNAFDDSYAARISEARAYPRDYFAVKNWNCPN